MLIDIPKQLYMRLPKNSRKKATLKMFVPESCINMWARGASKFRKRPVNVYNVSDIARWSTHVSDQNTTRSSYVCFSKVRSCYVPPKYQSPCGRITLSNPESGRPERLYSKLETPPPPNSTSRTLICQT